MLDAYLYDGLRTPFGRHAGALAPVRPDDLAAGVMRALLARSPWKPEEIEDVYLGCTNQAGEDSRNVARHAALLAGLPPAIPAQTVNRLCASGLAAVVDAARAITAGEGELFLAGGVESMSRAPFAMAKAEVAYAREARVFDTTLGARFPNPRLVKMYGSDSMPETGDNVAREQGISREEADRFAARSQERCERARAAGFLAGEIAPVEAPGPGKGTTVVREDEHPRPGTTLEALARLRPLFAGGVVTAGNASGVNDGAAALLVGSRAAGERAGVRPLARILSSAAVGVEPRVMGVGPAFAIPKALARAGLGAGPDGRGRGERGLREPGAGLPEAPGYPLRRFPREPQRRSHRARPPARRVRRPSRPHRGAGASPAWERTGGGEPVHRRRPGTGDGHGGSVMSSNVRTSTADRIAEIEIHRPEKKNALTGEMYDAMSAAFERAEADAGVHVILIRGQAGCFTAGNDLADFLSAGAGEGVGSPATHFLSVIRTAKKPVVAAVGGVAVGIGTTMLLHCELVYAAPDARFQMPFVPLGLAPEGGSSLLLPMLAGYQRAAELLLLGRPFGAERAMAAGLVNEVVPAERLLAHAREAALAVAALPVGVGAHHQGAAQAAPCEGARGAHGRGDPGLRGAAPLAGGEGGDGGVLPAQEGVVPTPAPGTPSPGAPRAAPAAPPR